VGETTASSSTGLTAGAIARPCPVVACRDASLAEVVVDMVRHGVTHAPVCDADDVAGVLSRASVTTYAALAGEALRSVTAEQAMLGPPVCVAHDTPLPELVRRVLREDSEAVVVQRDARLVGLVTTKSLLPVVFAELGEARRPAARFEVAQEILAQHDRLRSVLDQLEEIAIRVANGESRKTASLRMSARVLTSILLAHLEAEERRMLPLLRRADGPGAARADELLGEHDRHRSLLARLHHDLHHAEDVERAAVRALELVRVVRDDMAFEEEEYLVGRDEGF